MTERDKSNTYLCPKCDRHAFAWDGRAKIWMCYYASCSHTERVKDPVEGQLQTMFEALRYLVAHTPVPLEAGFVRVDQHQLLRELDEIIKLEDK